MSLRSFRARLEKPKFLGLLAVVTCLIAIPLLSTSSFAATPKSAIQFVPSSWVATNAKDPNLRILDVRISPLDYISAHLPNAINIADNN